MKHAILLLSAVLTAGIAALGAGCGNADDHASPVDAAAQMEDSGPPATIIGSIDGDRFVAQSALFGFQAEYSLGFAQVPGRHQEVTLTDFRDDCGKSDLLGKVLYFDLFQDLVLSKVTMQTDTRIERMTSASEAPVTRPGTFTVWLPALSGGDSPPSDSVAVVTYVGAHDIVAHSGTVTVTAVTDQTIAATFDITFGQVNKSGEQVQDAELTGSFVASGCRDWARSASIPGATVPQQPGR
jgi:hypothetical protein